MTEADAPGLIQSLLIKRQRTEIQRLADELGASALFIKSAWAEPVLYGGRGQRLGSDIDVLVSPQAFREFARGLVARGYRRRPFEQNSFTYEYESKSWVFLPEHAGVPVDLHRRLGKRPWFSLPTAGCLERAVAWDSIDGAIWSLSASDQLLYAALHMANHGFVGELHGVEDMGAMLRVESVDWSVVKERADRGGLSLPIRLVLEALVARGIPIDLTPFRLGGISRLKRRWLEDQLGGVIDSQRGGKKASVDPLAVLTALSGWPSALPHYAIRVLILRIMDRLFRGRDVGLSSVLDLAPQQQVLKEHPN